MRLAHRFATAVMLVLALALGAAAMALEDPPPPPSASDARVPATPYRAALPGYVFAFPRDDASHPAFQTEWWYYTGHLRAGDRRFGYQLTFFRVGLDPARAASRSAWAPHSIYFAHAAITDESRGRYRSDQRVMRPALGLAGADTAHYRVWVDDWSAQSLPDALTHRLIAGGKGFALLLELRPLKPPVIHGERGVSQKSSGLGRASHYLSSTRMATAGRLLLDGDSLTVSGESWMDHEFGSNQIGPGQQGWDWFSIQLDDGRELMLYVLRLTSGGIEPMSSGTLVESDGRARHLPLRAFTIEALGSWTSPLTGARYPAGWRVRVPDAAIDLTLEPTVANQELVTPPPLALAYWEGSVRVRGTHAGRAVSGAGYVELTGYAGRIPGF